MGHEKISVRSFCIKVIKMTICYWLQGSLVSRLLGLFQLMDEQPHFLHLWDRLGSKEAIKDFLLNTFYLLNELVHKNVYPSEWASMTMAANAVLLKAMQVSEITFLCRICISRPHNWPQKVFSDLRFSHFPQFSLLS